MFDSLGMLIGIAQLLSEFLVLAILVAALIRVRKSQPRTSRWLGLIVGLQLGGYGLNLAMSSWISTSLTALMNPAARGLFMPEALQYLAISWMFAMPYCATIVVAAYVLVELPDAPGERAVGADTAAA